MPTVRTLILAEELVSIGLTYGALAITIEKKPPFHKDVATLRFARECDLRQTLAVLRSMDVDATHAGALLLEVYLEA